MRSGHGSLPPHRHCERRRREATHDSRPCAPHALERACSTSQRRKSQTHMHTIVHTHTHTYTPTCTHQRLWARRFAHATVEGPRPTTRPPQEIARSRRQTCRAHALPNMHEPCGRIRAVRLSCRTTAAASSRGTAASHEAHPTPWDNKLRGFGDAHADTLRTCATITHHVSMFWVARRTEVCKKNGGEPTLPKDNPHIRQACTPAQIQRARRPAFALLATAARAKAQRNQK